MFDSSFMAQRRMWHLMEQRLRDAGRGETNETDTLLRQCKAKAEEESKSGTKPKRVVQTGRVGSATRFS